MQADIAKELIMMYKNDGFDCVEIRLRNNEYIAISGNCRVQTRGNWLEIVFDYYGIQILSDYIIEIVV